MGSYSSFAIGDHEVFSTKNGFDELLLSIFRPADWIVSTAPVSAELLAQDGRLEEMAGESDHTDYEYRTTVGIARDRLDLMGITLRYCEKVFDRGLSVRAQEIATDRDSLLPSELLTFYEGQETAVRAITFDKWRHGFQRILQGSHSISPDVPRPKTPLEDFPVGYMLGEHETGGTYGFPSYDTRVVLRVMLEGCPAELPLVLDLTDLVLGGWYEVGDDLARDTDDLVAANYRTGQRIIILTEGSSDSRILKSAVAVLYPHLSDYLTFMDFAELAVPGGAGTLVGFVKAFAGAGVINRVLAVFDNDTAAASALKALQGRTLPPNIGVLQLPYLPALEAYPTLGPTGPVVANVNGLAASLELYLGEDVLRQADGSLAPVHWRAPDAGLQRLHGEVTNKSRLQGTFFDKAAKAKASGNIDPSWSSMRAVLKHILQRASALRPCDL